MRSVSGRFGIVAPFRDDRLHHGGRRRGASSSSYLHMKPYLNTEDHPEKFEAILALEVKEPTAATDRPGHALLSRIGGERATQGPGNKIVTFGGKTHVVWQDSLEERYFARVRTFDREAGEWLPGQVLMEGIDEHSRPVIAVTPDGYLHVVMGGHNSPLQYRRSKRPNDSSEWEATVHFSSGTYPVLLADDEGRLLLSFRDLRHDGLDLWEHPPVGCWRPFSRLLRRDERFGRYSAFHNGFAWAADRRGLHLSTGLFLTFQEDRGPLNEVSGKYQGIGTLFSPDGGRHWERGDGEAVALPASPATLELMEEKVSDQPKPGLNHGGIAVDSRDRVYLAYTRHVPHPGEGLLWARSGAGDWERLPLAEAIGQHWPGFGVTTLRLSMTEDDRLCILGERVPLDHPEANWSPGERGRPAFWLRKHPELHRMIYMETADGGKTFVCRDLAPEPKAGAGQHLPTVERRDGANAIEGGRLPGVLYFEGVFDYPPDGTTVDNDVYFVQP